MGLKHTSISLGQVLLLLTVLTFSSSTPTESCDIFEGSWVLDNSYPPFYDPSLQCPFLDSDLSCLRNGRPDTMYLHYRWQPTGCDFSRFDGKEFLERNRGKKVMFVGDSLSKGQWQSLGCMLLAAVPNANYTFTSRGRFTTIFFLEYGVSVMYMKNGFLVNLINGTLVLDELSGSESWNGIDVLVFNSYHWWLHTGRYKTWDSYRVGDKTVKDMDIMEAYKIALTTWADWVDSNVDPTKTRVFFQGISSVHYRGVDWNEPGVRDCKGQTEPIKGSNYPGTKPPGDEVIKSVLGRMKRPAYLLDIALLTQLRKDGHPSIYSGGVLDCSHWCFPGVPDTWNQLMYTSLMQN